MPNDSLLLIIACGVQMIGITSVVAARISENSAAQTSCQVLFFVCFAIAGIASAWAMYVDDRSALFCASTLPIMAVGVTIDLGQPDAKSAI